MTNLISKLFGCIANLHLIQPLQNFINKTYINHFEINMSEFKTYNTYKSLNELFTRQLTTQRPISTDKKTLLSPSDGVCFESGTSSDLKALSVKDHNYNIDEFLDASINDNERSKELVYANIYLSPKDYHHYHAPCDIEILSALYIPAKLYSVAKKYLIKIPNLYCKNERVILRCKMPNEGILWLGFVGALNVGKMKFEFDENIQTNAHNLQKTLYKYQNILIKKGERIGNFELGSTIVVIAQSSHLRLNIMSGETIKFSDKIGELL